METENTVPIEFDETSGNDETVYTWTKEGKELARIIAKEPKSHRPKIEFVISKSLIPYYDEDKKSALDEIGEMSMYSGMETRTEEGYIHGNMYCSHNASLGIENLVQSVKDWVSKQSVTNSHL